MEYTKELARKLCEQMGIVWDENALAPTIRGTAITRENIGTLMAGTRPTWADTQIPCSYDLDTIGINSPYYTVGAIVVECTASNSTFNGSSNAPLAA